MKFHPAVLLVLGACGGAGDGAEEMRPLVPDPAVMTGCPSAGVSAGQSRAKVVACDAELLAGRLAAGRPGDFVLENSAIRVTVRGPGEGYYLYGTTGGSIIDAAPIGAEDLVKEILPLIGFNAGMFDEMVIVEAGDDGPAELALRGHAGLVPLVSAAVGGAPLDVIVEQRYRLAPDASAVELSTRLWPGSGGGEARGALLDLVLFGGRVHPFLPGAGFATDGGASGPFLASDGTTASYGLVYADERVEFLGIDMIRGVIGPTVATGEPAISRFLVVGDGSVASVVEHAHALRAEPTGDLTGTASPGVRVFADDEAGRTHSVAVAGADGAWRMALPPGAWQVHTEAADRLPGTAVAAQAGAGTSTPVEAPLEPAGALTVSVKDGDGAPIPARLLVGDRIYWVGASGEGSFPLPPGSYDVHVSRGMEYEAFSVTGLAVPGRVDAVLQRVVDTAGWISLDTHLHCEMSPDSSIPLDERILAVAGEGVELPIATDHDVVTDYAPVIDELGLGAFMTGIIGNEASSIVWGHLNAWPLARDPARAGGGSVPWFERAPGEVFALLRADDPARLVQVNHPINTSGLFNAISLDPDTLTALRDPTQLDLPAGTDLSDLSFDAIEVANSSERGDFEEMFDTWLAMTAAGHTAAATGSSDSHGASRFSGNSRTMVWVGVGADDPARVDIAAVNEALRARRAVVSQGAFVTAGIVAPGGGAASLPGELVDLSAEANVVLRLRVQAAPWMSTGRILLYERTAMISEITLDPTSILPVRYQGDVTLPRPARDTFYVVRVDPGGDGFPVLESPAASFTNPLLVDSDGDGVWEP